MRSRILVDIDMSPFAFRHRVSLHFLPILIAIQSLESTLLFILYIDFLSIVRSIPIYIYIYT